MNIFGASDHHFFHKNIIKYANRPFDFNDENCVIDNAKLMIERHNEIVTNDDIVILGGDLSASLKGREVLFSKIIPLLNGKKILIRGNHDFLLDSFYKEAGIIGVYDYLLLGETFISHYTCYKSNFNKEIEKEHISIIKNNHIKKIIHGHIHNKKPYTDDGYDRLNICVDYEPNNYYPQDLNFIKAELLQKLEFLL